jgi:hypothetical protein
MIGARLTVVTQIRHQASELEPANAFDFRWSKQLKSDEETYTRKLKAGTTWKPFPKGWTDTPALVRVENMEGKRPQSIPSDEDREQINKRVVEIAYLDSDGKPLGLVMQIKPGEAHTFPPLSLDNIYFRARVEVALIHVAIVPE